MRITNCRIYYLFISRPSTTRDIVFFVSSQTAVRLCFLSLRAKIASTDLVSDDDAYIETKVIFPARGSTDNFRLVTFMLIKFGVPSGLFSKYTKLKVPVGF